MPGFHFVEPSLPIVKGGRRMPRRSHPGLSGEGDVGTGAGTAAPAAPGGGGGPGVRPAPRAGVRVVERSGGGVRGELPDDPRPTGPADRAAERTTGGAEAGPDGGPAGRPGGEGG